MPLAGSLDIRSLLTDAPTVTLADHDVHVDDVDIVHVLYEVKATDIEGLVPPALNPTIPPVVSFLAYRAKDSGWGPFSLVQARVTARAGVRPRAFLLSARCDNPVAAEALSGSWGFRIGPAEIALRRFHDRVECRVVADRRPILEMAVADPKPTSGQDIQYAPGMHLARIEDADGTVPRLLQIDTEYVFRRADRGRPELGVFDVAAWTQTPLVTTEAISASFCACDVTFTPIHYVCNPDIPASEGTTKVA